MLTTATTSSGGTARASPRRNFPASDATRQRHDLHTEHSVVGSRTCPRSTGSDAPRLVRRALARAEPARPLTLDEAYLVDGRAGRGTRSTSCCSPARLRDLEHGEIVTYSRKVFIPLTMLCRDHCHYCTFAKPPAKLDPPS